MVICFERCNGDKDTEYGIEYCQARPQRVKLHVDHAYTRLTSLVRGHACIYVSTHGTPTHDTYYWQYHEYPVPYRVAPVAHSASRDIKNILLLQNLTTFVPT